MEDIFTSIKKQKNKLVNGSTLEEKIEGLEENFSFGNNIYVLFDKLCELFEELNLIVSSEKDLTKFKFIHAYPDTTIDTNNNVITYNIVSRRPLQVNGKAVAGNGFKLNKPTHVSEEYNTVTGNVEEIYKTMFENIISMTVFTTKARLVNDLARLLEGLMLKYSSYIKKYIDQIVYLGTSDIRFLDRGDELNPFYSRELQFKVVTTELFKLELEQMKSINIQMK